MGCKIIFTSDLHGEVKLYRQLFYIAEREKVNVIILGGDLCPIKKATPATQRDFLINAFIPLLADFKDANPNIRIFAIMGNDDFKVNLDVLEENKHLLNLLHEKAYDLCAELKIVGYTYVPLTPFVIKDWEMWDTETSPVEDKKLNGFITTKDGIKDVSFDPKIRKYTIQQDIEKLRDLSDPKKTVYVFHSPPFNTALDVIKENRHVGSKAIRDFIQRHRPPLTLHGHIHEAPMISGKYWDKLDQTLMINVGKSDDEKLNAVIFNTKDMEKTLKYIKS